MKPSKIEVSSYKGRRFTWQRAVLTVLALGLAGFLVLFGLVLGGAHSQLVNQPQTMIVLGCKVHGDGTPSVLLRDRLDTALDYWQEHQDVTILVSGGQGPDEPEAEADAAAATSTSGWAMPLGRGTSSTITPTMPTIVTPHHRGIAGRTAMRIASPRAATARSCTAEPTDL